MSPLVAVAVFLVSLSVTLSAAELFATRLDRLGTRFGLSEALVGLLTAVAADGPEISSALVALAKGAHTASVGVLVGSNVFNLAAMIGVSALVAGAVRLPRASLVFEGSVGLLVTLVGACVLLGWLAPAVGAVVLAAVLVPYVYAVIRTPVWLGRAVEEREWVPAPRARSVAHPAREVSLMLLEVAVIVAGSFGMVQAALSLGDRWGISGAVIGVLILAPLTSLPNAFTALRLGRQGRGSALLTETLNSNTINLVFGAVVPAIFVGLTSLATAGRVNIAWMVGMTVVSLALLARPGGVGRSSGVLLVALYAGFVVTQLAMS